MSFIQTDSAPDALLSTAIEAPKHTPSGEFVSSCCGAAERNELYGREGLFCAECHDRCGYLEVCYKCGGREDECSCPDADEVNTLLQKEERVSIQKAAANAFASVLAILVISMFVIAVVDTDERVTGRVSNDFPVMEAGR